MKIRRDFKEIRIDLSGKAAEVLGTRTRTTQTEIKFRLSQDILKKRILDFILLQDEAKREDLLEKIFSKIVGKTPADKKKNFLVMFRNSFYSDVTIKGVKEHRLFSRFISESFYEEICEICGVPLDYFARDVQEEKTLEEEYRKLFPYEPFPKRFFSKKNYFALIQERFVYFINACYGQEIWEGEFKVCPSTLRTIIKDMIRVNADDFIKDEADYEVSRYYLAFAKFAANKTTHQLDDDRWLPFCKYFGISHDFFFRDFHYERSLRLAIEEGKKMISSSRMSG